MCCLNFDSLSARFIPPLILFLSQAEIGEQEADADRASKVLYNNDGWPNADDDEEADLGCDETLGELYDVELERDEAEQELMMRREQEELEQAQREELHRMREEMELESEAMQDEVDILAGAPSATAVAAAPERQQASPRAASAPAPVAAAEPDLDGDEPMPAAADVPRAVAANTSDCVAARTRSTPIAIAAVRWEIPSLRARATIWSKARSRM